MRHILLTTILFFCTMACQAQMTPEQFYDAVNAIRKENHRKPLTRSAMLELKSEMWLKKMHEKYDGLAHDWACKEAEILTDCDNYLRCWMDSRAHREILLSKEFTKIGIAQKDGDWCARLD